MVSQHLAMGVAVAVVCLAGLRYRDWLLTRSRNLQRLQQHLGAESARQLLTAFLLLGAAFGVLLAGGWIRPMQWD